MKAQCRTCGKWFKESDMLETDYRTHASQGDPNEMVCEGCYAEHYGKCAECGAIRESVDLIKNGNDWVCNPDTVEHQA